MAYVAAIMSIPHDGQRGRGRIWNWRDGGRPHLLVRLLAHFHDAGPQLSNDGHVSRRHAHVSARRGEVHHGSRALERRHLRRWRGTGASWQRQSAVSVVGRPGCLERPRAAPQLTWGSVNESLMAAGTSAEASASATCGTKSVG